MATFYETLTSAVNEFVTHGFRTQEQLDEWLLRIRTAAKESLTPEYRLQEMLQSALRGVYDRLVSKGGIARYHAGVSKYTLEKLAPQLRAQLNQRIMVSAQLIKLNRKSAIEKTLQRFAGWASSVPTGGTKAAAKPDTKKAVRKALANLPFEERRVLVDQGHKLTAAINEVVAEGGGAIAAKWNSHWRQLNYNFREDHKERDQHIYLIKGSWAHQRGLIKPGEDGYTTDITKPGEEVFCRCWYTYLYNLQDLPPAMLTAKGKEALNRKVA